MNLGAAGYTEIDGGFLSPDAMAERKAETSAAVAGAARALALPAGLAPGRPRPDGGVALRLVNAASNPEVDAFINNVEGQRAAHSRTTRSCRCSTVGCTRAIGGNDYECLPFRLSGILLFVLILMFF